MTHKGDTGMARKVIPIEERLEDFRKRLVIHPCCDEIQREFVRLVQAVHDHPTHDHADYELLEWVDKNWV
jgi:hypothetical protein